MLVQVDGGHFCCGIILEDDVVVEAAPILRKWIIGKQRDWLRSYFKRKGWKAVIVKEMCGDH
jgi:hypothetical protein